MYITLPLRWKLCDTRYIFKRSLMDRNLEFDTLLDWLPYQVEENSIPLQLTNSWRENRLIQTFPWKLVWCEVRIASFGFWHRIAVSFSHSDNHYFLSLSFSHTHTHTNTCVTVHMNIYIYIDRLRERERERERKRERERERERDPWK